MSPKPRSDEYQADRHRRQTEWQLVLGGFVLIVLIGGLLLWLLFGSTVALIGLGIAVGGIAIFLVLFALLRALEAWTKSE